MESGILSSIKKLLGSNEEYTDFDLDIIMHINSAFMTLTQLGIGPVGGFRIEDYEATWENFVSSRLDLEGIKTFVYLKVRLVFDPPQMGFLIEAIKEQIKELEWRLNAQVEGGN